MNQNITPPEQTLPKTETEREAKPKSEERPTSREIAKELKRLNEQSRFRQTLKNTLYTLITIVALATLIAIFVFPVFQVHGTAMSPALKEGQILISIRDSEPERGDVIACYYGNKLILRRVVAIGGDSVQISDDGHLFVNGEKVQEDYVSEFALGTCDIEMPFTVPVGECFLLGDNRTVALDSRTSLLGTVPNDQIAGRILVRVWPLDAFGAI